MQAKIETLKARNSSDEEYLVYPRTLTKCVTNENGENLDVIISNVVKDSDVTAIKGNVFIQEDAGETDNYVPINADLLGGNAPEYYSPITDTVRVERESTQTDYYVPINAQLLGGYPAEHFVTMDDLENFSGGGGGASTAAQVSYDDNIGDVPFGADNIQDALDNLKDILGTFDDYVISKTSEALNNSKAYTNTEVADVLAEAKAYTNTEVAEALAEAKAYTDENGGGGTADNALALDGHPASYFATNSQLNNYATATQLNNVLDEAKAYAESLFQEYIYGES